MAARSQPSDVEIAPLCWDPVERESAAQVLAAAFRDNPLNQAVIGGSPRRRLRSNLVGGRTSLDAASRGAWGLGACRRGRLEGVLVAAPLGVHPLPLPSAWSQLRCLVGQGWHTARLWSRVHFELERLRPRRPHWYLDLLGIEPRAQGAGIGHALLAALHGRVDEERAPSYLETDRRANLDFYERAGYDVIGTEVILGVEVWRLWREGRTL